MSDDGDDESLAKSLYKEDRRRYYIEGIVITMAVGIALLIVRHGLSTQMFTSDMEAIAMYGGGLIASMLIAVRVTLALPGLGIGSALSNALISGIVSAISIFILGFLLVIPSGIVALPLAAALDLFVTGASRTDLNLVIAFGIAFGTAAVFTAAAVSTGLTDAEEQQLTSAIESRSQIPSDVNVEIVREVVDDDPSDSSNAATAEDTPSSETTHDLEKQLEMAAAYLDKSESRISDSDIETAQTQLSRAEKHLRRAENNESALPDRYDQLRSRAESLRSLIENADRITSKLDTAEDCLDAAASHITHNDIGAAKKQLATAKGRFTRVEGVIEDTSAPLPDRHESLRSRCDSLETSIEDAQIGQPLELASECLDDCESALSVQNTDSARNHLSTADQHLTEVEQAPSQTPDQYDQLRARQDRLQTDIERLERIDSQLDTATDCLETASSHLSSGAVEAANTQLATAKGRLTQAENEASDAEISLPDRYESLQNRVSDVEESVEVTQEIEQSLEMAETCLDVCESHISDGDFDVAHTQLSKAEQHLTRFENADVAPPDQYEKLISRQDSLRELLDQSQGVSSQLETAAECLDTASSHLSDGDLTGAKKQVSTAEEHLTEIGNELEQVSAAPSDRHEELQARCESLRESIDKLAGAHSRFETAAECLESAEDYLEKQEFEAARTQLSTAKGRLTRAENEMEQMNTPVPDRYETLRARCQSLEETIDSEQRRVQADNAVTAAVDAMNAGHAAYGDGDLATAASNFEAVPDQLETVREIEVDIEELSSDLSPESVAAETARGKVYVEMQRAEQLVADGHDALERRDYEAAVEAYEDALSKLRMATGIARDHDLPQTWELDQRQETIATYLDNAEDERDAADENRLETATQRLDRARRLTETAEQHVEVDDSVAAWEDIQQARDVVDDAFELLSGTSADTSEPEQRASELSERIETIAADLPQEVRMEGTAGTASKRELLTYLQELSVIFGESPSQDFIDAYGVYPASAYIEVFDAWDAALSEANLAPIDEQARDRRVYSRVDILDAIVDLANELESVPTPKQMNDQGAVSTATVEKRFESWETAVRLAGLETEPTLDIVRELAGSGETTEDEQRDTETISTDTSNTSEAQSEPAETEIESDAIDTTDTQGSDSGADSAGESTDTDAGTKPSQSAPADIQTSEFADLTNFQRDVLVILAGLEDPKGLSIKEELETYYDDEIHHGRLYPNLDTLVERGFVEKFAIDNRSNGYRLSDTGRRHLRSRWDWEDAHTPSAEQSDRQEAELSDPETTEETASEMSTPSVDIDDSSTEADDEGLDVDDDVDTLVDDLLDDIEQIEDDDS